MTAAIERGEWSVAQPGRTLPPGKTRYPFYRRLGGSQGRSRTGGKPRQTGIRSRTVQTVVAIPTELPGPRIRGDRHVKIQTNTRAHARTQARAVTTWEYEALFYWFNRLKPATRIPLQPNHTETPTHIEPRTIRPMWWFNRIVASSWWWIY